MEQVFGTSLQPVTHTAPSGSPSDHRVRTGRWPSRPTWPASSPAVLGLDDRPQTRALYQIAHSSTVSHQLHAAAAGHVYDFPAGTDGTGQTIAIIELGGGFSDGRPDDLLRQPGHHRPEGHRGRGGRRAEQARPGPGRRGRRGAARHRGHRRAGPEGEHRRLLRAEHRRRLPQRDHHGRARLADPHGDEHQLGPGRESMDRAGPGRSWTRPSSTPPRWASRSRRQPATTAAPTARPTARSHVDFPAASPHVLACGGTTPEGRRVNRRR